MMDAREYDRMYAAYRDALDRPGDDALRRLGALVLRLKGTGLALRYDDDWIVTRGAASRVLCGGPFDNPIEALQEALDGVRAGE